MKCRNSSHVWSLEGKYVTQQKGSKILRQSAPPWWLIGRCFGKKISVFFCGKSLLGTLLIRVLFAGIILEFCYNHVISIDLSCLVFLTSPGSLVYIQCFLMQRKHHFRMMKPLIKRQILGVPIQIDHDMDWYPQIALGWYPLDACSFSNSEKLTPSRPLEDEVRNRRT